MIAVGAATVGRPYGISTMIAVGAVTDGEGLIPIPTPWRRRPAYGRSAIGRYRGLLPDLYPFKSQIRNLPFSPLHSPPISQATPLSLKILSAASIRADSGCGP